MLLTYPPTILIYLIPVVLLSLTLHELSHAYFSYRLGDPTAKNLGRLTLNPLKHLDILGTLMILLSPNGFGWAKPVPINPAYYGDRKKGTMLVSLAGPLSNIFLALVFAVPLYYIKIKFNVPDDQRFLSSFDYRAVIFNFSSLAFIINIGLAVFNILPVPPLDGSKILSGILPSRYYFKMMEYENYIGIIFLVVIFMFPWVLRVLLSPVIYLVETAITSIVIPIINVLT